MKFEMFVYCRRNGVSCDAGLHATEHGESLAEVQPIFDREGRCLQQHYDEIQVTISCDGENVSIYSLRRPEKDTDYDNNFTGSKRSI